MIELTALNDTHLWNTVWWSGAVRNMTCDITFDFFLA